MKGTLSHPKTDFSIPSTTELDIHTPKPLQNDNKVKDLDDIVQMRSQLDDVLMAYLSKLPPEDLNLTEEELLTKIEPNVKDSQMRIGFWSSYEKKTFTLTNKITARDFYENVCSRQAFFKKIKDHPYKLLWYLVRPKSYDIHLKECLDVGLQKLRDEILTAKIQFPNGFLDPKAAAVVMQALVFLDNRVRGPLAQRLEINSTTTSKNINVNINQEQKPKNLEELNQRIESLRAQLDGARAIPMLEANSDDHVSIDTILESRPVADYVHLPKESDDE